MIIRKHNIELKDLSASEMARFRQIMLGIWRQQIEDEKNAGEMEKFVADNYIAIDTPDIKIANNSAKNYHNDLIYVNGDGKIIKVEVNKSQYITVVLPDEKKILFSDLDFSGSTFKWNNINRQIVANIAGYYGKQVNVKEIGANYDMNDKSLAYTLNKKIWLHPSPTGGVDPILNDKYNLQSTLVHENNHQKEVKKGKKYTYTAHAKVYLKQFQHSSFKNTTKSYYEGQMANFIQYLDYASGHKEKGWQDILKEFNDSKILGGYRINYRESGGTQLFDDKGNDLIISTRDKLDGPN